MRVVLLSLVLLAACSEEQRAGHANVLVLIADDVGVDRVAAYGEHPDPGRTPHIDALAARGVLFRNVWSNPLCSPTRATLFTGRYAFRTGIGAVVSPDFAAPGLGAGEWTLPEALAERAPVRYRSALLGKWHLAGALDGADHPRALGFEHHAGALGNLGEPDEPERYFDFTKVVDGEPVAVQRYATTDTVDDALAAIERFAGDPWLVVVSFNAAHKPYHRPPEKLFDVPLSGSPDEDPVGHHKAMVQALDSEIGRLLAGLSAELLARTHVVFVGDNGTQTDATQAPFVPLHGKGSLSEGGVNVPLVIAGPAVARPGSECAALVNTTDLFATCLELCGASPAPPDGVTLDSLSLAPYLADPGRASLRDFVYAERFSPNHSPRPRLRRRAVRGPRYKLVLNEDAGVERFYDLELDPFEARNLLEAALPAPLETELDGLRARLHGLVGE
jgi:arylsulfatase A-like enzyme